LHNEYEAVVAVHTDREHLHAHIVLNSVNMVNDYKFQYHNGDWKAILQPITNRLCEEDGLDIMPAEYSKDPKNMSRPEWERENSYTTLIKDDVNYCALLAEDEHHFMYLLSRLGYEVKEGKHIAVKAPGMKRFKGKTLVDVPQSTGVERLELPKTLVEYRRLSLQEKADRFPFERLADDKAFNYFMEYLTEIGSSVGFSEAYDEFAEISECWGKMQEEKLVERELEKSMYLCEAMGMTTELFQPASADIKSNGLSSG